MFNKARAIYHFPDLFAFFVAKQEMTALYSLHKSHSGIITHAHKQERLTQFIFCVKQKLLQYFTDIKATQRC